MVLRVFTGTFLLPTVPGRHYPKWGHSTMQIAVGHLHNVCTQFSVHPSRVFGKSLKHQSFSVRIQILDRVQVGSG